MPHFVFNLESQIGFLMISKMLGHYQITNQLGKGGMGEVYRAKDEKLGRDVAIKVLPEEFAKDADRVARFQREAKLLASLNHPNIAAIHGLEESGGTQFLVLELVEGETLADQIAGSAGVLAGKNAAETAALPAILKTALQIAEALEAAHEKGVIHRDLKPANIKVTPEGKVKVLDFGLAKAFAGEQSELNLSNSPTLSNVATMQGVILGTAAYMAPEQARGKAVDKRADIWAFGCVLFEMLTGRAAFSGSDVTDILAAVIRSEPDWQRVPARVRPLLRRCLQKDPNRRLRDIGDVKLELEEVLANPDEVLVPPATEVEPRSKLGATLLWITAILVFSVITGIVIWTLRKPELPQVTWLSYELPKGQQLGDTTEPILAISPNGRQFVYSTSEGLYLRSLGEMDTKLIAGTGKEKIEQPFFSPDSKWIGYWSPTDYQLKKIAISGGAPIPLCNTGRSFGGASWDSDNIIVYSDLQGGGVMRVPANGGTPEYLIKRKPKWEFSGESFRYPQLLPDGKSVLFTKLIRRQDSTSARIMVQSPGSGEPKELFEGYVARYLPTGHIVYMVGDNILGMGGHNLFAVPFELHRLEPTGGPVQLVKDIMGPYGLHYSISDSGTLMYIPGRAGELVTGKTLVWVDRNGKAEPLAAPVRNYFTPKISPDGTKVAIVIQEIDGNSDIWKWDLIHKTLTPLKTAGRNNTSPVWAADGKRIAFDSGYPQGNYEKDGVYWKAADGTGGDELLALSSGLGWNVYPNYWSKDGKNLIGTVGFLGDIGMMSVEGDHALKPLLREEYRESQPAISPDENWIAYTSDESRKNEIYVRSFPDVNRQKLQVSTSGGDTPLWSPDGRELFFLNGDAVMAVSVKTQPSFNIVGTPQVLFHGTYVGSHWDISRPDGKRFLMMKPPGTSGGESAAEVPMKINVVLNWFEELKQQVSAK
jgi:serine/threonine-protein kinase